MGRAAELLKQLDCVDDPEVFQIGEVKDSCAGQGQCIKCGACCIGYDIDVPSPDASGTILSPKLDPCLHLHVNTRGLLECALHGQSSQPSGCRDYRGNFQRPALSGRMSNYDIMSRLYTGELLHGGNEEDMRLADHLVRRGMLTLKPLCQQSLGLYLHFFQIVLSMDVLPHALLEGLNVREWWLSWLYGKRSWPSAFRDDVERFGLRAYKNWNEFESTYLAPLTARAS